MQFKSYVSSAVNTPARVGFLTDDYLEKYDVFKLLGIGTKNFTPNPYGFTKGDDCSIRSICATIYAEPKDFDEEGYNSVYKRLSDLGLRMGKVMNHVDVVGEFLLNYDYSMVKPSGPVPLGTFLSSRKNGKYIISIESIHLFAYINGVIYDCEDCFPFIRHALGHNIDLVYCPKDESMVLFG